MFAPQRLQTIARLTRLELGVFWNNRGLRSVALLFVFLLSIQLYLSSVSMANRQRIVAEAESAARKNWLNQGDRDPHGAAHHGTFLFKPAPPLALFDPGLYPYLGTTVRIEAHVRHRLTNLPAENSVDNLRLTFFTPAQLVQGVLPLFLIFVGFATVTREREQGTLPLLLSCGVRWPDLLLAKLASLGTIALLLSLPWWGTLAFTAAESAFSLGTGQDTTVRAVLLLVVSGLLTLIWLLLTVGVSATVTTSQSSLGILLSVWCVTTLCSAPLASTLASIAFPLPTQEEVKQWSDRKKYDPVTGENIFKKTRENLQQKLLTEYNVKSLKDLPFKFDGVVMQAAEEQTDEIYQTDARELNGMLSHHDRALSLAGLLSPFLAARDLSSALCATDRQHHEDFSEAAEQYRRALVLAVNKADAEKDTPEALRGAVLWESVADFRYQQPSFLHMYVPFQLAFWLLLTWCFGTVLLFGGSTLRPSIR